MSFVKKIKDILFEEEEEETREIKVPSEPVKEPKIVKIESLKEQEFNVSDKAKEPVRKDVVRSFAEEEKKETFRSDNTFSFPDFDEKEFADSYQNYQTPSYQRARQNTNVLEFERKKKEEKRDYSRFDKSDSIRDEKKKFKPSPIISPVYGILNQDYKAEDIVDRKDNASNINIDEVRKKAFENVKEDLPKVTKEEVIDEPVVTFFEEKDNVIEDKKDYKTIDDLLEEASTEIALEDTLEIPARSNLDAIEEELEKLDKEESDSSNVGDTSNEDDLDNDLFELIDSMYDDREEV